MRIRKSRTLLIALSPVLSLLAGQTLAQVHVQCPAALLTETSDGAGGFLTFDPGNPTASTDPGCQDPQAANFFDTCKVQKDPITGQPSGATTDPAVLCRVITCGDGHAYMADRDRSGGNPDKGDTYIFGFSDVTNVAEGQILTRGNPPDPSGYPLGSANISSPTLFAREGQKLFLTLANSGMRERPDLFDPHTVHYHGFPNAASSMDGEPMSSFGINQNSSITYFYDNENPGTYMYHCHVEAAEHMQMGMLGNLYVMPKQDGTAITSNGKTYDRFAYNDCPSLPDTTDPMCGSTGYDVMYFLQETAMDPNFHAADQNYNRLNFADMDDTYPLLNGRGYPDTVDPAAIVNANGNASQPIPAIPMSNGATQHITAGQRVLLHLSSLSTVDFYTLASSGIPMRVVGQGAKLMRGPGGINTSYATNSVTLGGGEGYDIMLDTTGVAPGTYFLYTTNLHRLTNNTEDFGGMMTEIVVD